MKTNLLGTVLVIITIVSVLITAAMSCAYVQATRKYRRLQHQAAMVDRNRKVANALATEALEFGKRHPSIIPVLRSVGVLQSAQGSDAGALINRAAQ